MKKLFLIEMGAWTLEESRPRVWVSHSGKTMQAMENALTIRDEWEGERIFFIVESDSGVHAKKAVRDLHFAIVSDIWDAQGFGAKFRLTPEMYEQKLENPVVASYPFQVWGTVKKVIYHRTCPECKKEGKISKMFLDIDTFWCNECGHGEGQ